MYNQWAPRQNTNIQNWTYLNMPHLGLPGFYCCYLRISQCCNINNFDKYIYHMNAYPFEGPNKTVDIFLWGLCINLCMDIQDVLKQRNLWLFTTTRQRGREREREKEGSNSPHWSGVSEYSVLLVSVSSPSLRPADLFWWNKLLFSQLFSRKSCLLVHAGSAKNRYQVYWYDFILLTNQSTWCQQLSSTRSYRQLSSLTKKTTFSPNSQWYRNILITCMHNKRE